MIGVRRGGVWCIFCQKELVRTTHWPLHWRHVDSGLIVCVARLRARYTPPTVKRTLMHLRPHDKNIIVDGEVRRLVTQK